MYVEMPPQKKKTAWTQRVKAVKVCYCHKLSFYIPPHCYNVKGDAIRPLPSNTVTPRLAATAHATFSPINGTLIGRRL